jgi:hypothetical protein
MKGGGVIQNGSKHRTDTGWAVGHRITFVKPCFSNEKENRMGARGPNARTRLRRPHLTW